MDARLQKAKALLAGEGITRESGHYWVPSQSGGRRHRLVYGDLLSYCSCDDFELTASRANIFLRSNCIEIARWEVYPQPLEMPPPVKRKTYPQDWPNYDLAQTREKKHVLELLADLTSGIADEKPKSAKGGRPAVPLRDAIHAIVYKVYSGFSARRFACDLADARADGRISRPLCHNSVIKPQRIERCR
jgi:hypothetical protein